MDSRLTRGIALSLIAAASFGCTQSATPPAPTDRTIINLRTGEERRVADDESVPDGWATCASDETCPEPYDCEILDGASCDLRTDCVAPDHRTAVGGAAPSDVDEGEVGYACTTTGVVEPHRGGCEDVPACQFLCPDGTHSPIDAMGCTHSCECVPDGTDPVPEPDSCDDVPGCEFLCPEGTHNPIDARGCTHSCECVPDDCRPEECGPPPLGMPRCSDGGDSVVSCDHGETGRCGWQISCPIAPPPGPGPGLCDPALCGPAPLAEFLCPDDSSARTECRINTAGGCGWLFICPGA